MSFRQPMWYCHECHAEMRPLMVPDPVCASCRSSFVETIENPANDPREFAAGPGLGGAGEEEGFDNFLVALQTLMNRGMQQQQNQRTPTSTPPQQRQGSRVMFQVRGNSGGPRQTSFTWGHMPPGSPGPGAVPTMSDFVRSAPTAHEAREGATISGPLFAQYLMSLLGGAEHPLFPLPGGMPENGRMGDYVFSQDALDQIITQIMESSNAHRPVPATETIIENLPREVLIKGSHLLSKDCAVCKDQFQLETEDPDEQVVITLPCKHPFHQPCILPWLKSSGTCPVCRHALVPQPEQPASPNSSSSSSSPVPPQTSSSFNTSSNNNSTQRSRARSQSPFGRPTSSSSDSPSGTGLFSTLFGNFAGLGTGTSNRTAGQSGSSSPYRHAHAHRSGSSDPASPTFPSSFSSRPNQQQQNQQQQNRDSSSSSSRRSQNQNGRPHVPGQWNDDMMDLD